MAAEWPTHVAKARERRRKAFCLKRRNRRERKLNATGKRGGRIVE